MDECPQVTTLAGYLRGQLAPDDAEILERHLADCRRCMDRVLAFGQESSLPVIQRCHIVRELGRGRFGVVYKAWWLNDKPRLVALKCLTFAGKVERQRFDREIQVLKRIDSPHIVKCLESGTTAGVSYYIMSLIRGSHLDEYLRSSTSSLDQRLVIFQRTCGAVAEAHAKGVIHRDLKPRNILIDDDGQPHILDFGICTLGAEDWSSSARRTVTRVGDILGTLKYMSPEQAWGGVSGVIDKRSDIWALGVMLYEIVTNGDYPYDLGSTPDKPAHEALLERIRRETPVLPRLRCIERGRQLEILLERCLAWEPERRLSSAAQLEADVGRYRIKERIRTRPLSLAHRLHRLATGIAAKSRWVVLLALIATVQVMLWVTTFVFDVRWHVIGHAYSSSEALAATAPFDDARDNIVVVGTLESTVTTVVDFAQRNHIEGVTSDIKSWRAVHGYLMQRLALAAPKVVVWDFYFRTPQPGDSDFVRGTWMLEEAGVPVVLAVQTYNDKGTPQLSQNIATPLGDSMRHGAIAARDMVMREGEFVMAIKRFDGRVLPGLPLATLAAALHPNARIDIDWPGRAKHFDILYQTGPGSYLRERDRIELTKAFKQQRPQFAVRAGDLLGCKTFDLVRPVSWKARTVPYEELLTCPADRLPEKVMNKVLVIGEVRRPRFGLQADRHRVRYGGTIINDVPGCYLMADAIAGLMDKRYMKSAFPLAPTTFLLMLLLSVAGCLLPWGVAMRGVLAPPRNRQVLFMSLVALSAICFMLAVLFDNYYTVHLAMGTFSLAVPACGSFWVEFTRGRHRVFEERRRTVESLALEADLGLQPSANDRNRSEQDHDGYDHGRYHTPHPSDDPALGLS